MAVLNERGKCSQNLSQIKKFGILSELDNYIQIYFIFTFYIQTFKNFTESTFLAEQNKQTTNSMV
jgi:hypothetical protein